MSKVYAFGTHIFDYVNSTGDINNEKFQEYIKNCLIDITADDELNQWPCIEYKFNKYVKVSDANIQLDMPYILVDNEFEDVVMRFLKII